MRLVPVTSLQSGMKLGKKIYTEDGLVLLAAGVELTDKLISRLCQLGIGYIYIEDALTEDVHVPELIHEETRLKALSVIKREFNMVPKGFVSNRAYHLGAAFGQMMESILDDIGSRDDTMIMLQDMKSTDFSLFDHSLNVCLYTLVLGLANGYNKKQLLELGLGALLHDIGKMQIPSHILQKPGKLTDEEFKHVQAHTKIGFEILRSEPGIPLVSAVCALQHHERLNGSGYPNGFKKDEIHEYAKWVALADSYDAMTANRVYRPGLLPHKAVESLYAGSGTLYEQSMLERFRDCVAIYPLGLTVTLSTGETGVVVRIHHQIPQRPVIRVFKDRNGQEVPPYEIDLSTALSIIITDIPGIHNEMLQRG
ncbi:HD-GYP domain-containing protein [Paenibacillus sp. JX-17]|uniref:HD-GYP domain-containing protein n=1 Tax=Paenibacillus lacisoli TaxID=3064525 RepID=A0ABT9CGR4_9BACL|nr:HD-GYP domain-containing protein [Paenibacillus sp. JX-17]MDO7908479.1 HD-GYP domain-containing protein [Paenibacillus sp. JX-17]